MHSRPQPQLLRPQSSNPRASAAFPIDGLTRGDVLNVVCEQRANERQHLGDAAICHSVIDSPMLAAWDDKAAPAKAGQVLRHLGLRESELLHQLTD